MAVGPLMPLKALLAGLERLKLYTTLPSLTAPGKFYCMLAGIMNIALTLPSLVFTPVADFYDASCRSIANRCRVALYGLPARSYDCEGILALHPRYEEKLTLILLKLLRPGSVFIDVGAHIGRYTLLASKLVGPQGLVIALEPVPENFATLHSNIKENNINNVIALPLACGKTNRPIEILVPPGRSGATSKNLPHFTGLPLKGKTRRVTAVKLDTLLLDILRLKKVDVIKIDVEGAEIEVLEGAIDTLRKFKPKLIIEIRQTTRPIVTHILESISYTLYKLDNTNILAI